MKIECLLKRIGGTKAEIGGVEYHFAEQADGKFIAEVTDKSHIERFLSILEAYQEAGVTKVSSKPSNPVEVAPTQVEPEATTQTNEAVLLPESATEQDELIAEAKSLGIRANRNWGVERLRNEIKALKAG